MIYYYSLVQKYKNRIKEMESSQKKDLQIVNKKGFNAERVLNKVNNQNMTRNSSKLSHMEDF